MSNKIVHQKVPLDKNGCMLLDAETVMNLHKAISKGLPDDYILLTSPTDLNVIDGDIKIIHIDAKEYSVNELREIIEKAENYDVLCD